MKSTVKIYVITALYAAFAMPATLQGATQQEEKKYFNEDLPVELWRDIATRVAQPLINYIREQYPFTLEHTLKHTFVDRLNPNKTHSIDALSANGNFIVSQYHVDVHDVSIVEIWDVLTGQLLLSFPRKNGMRSVKISPDGKLILIISSSKTFKEDNLEILDLRGKLLYSHQNQNGIDEANFSPDGNRIVIIDAKNNTGKIWTMNTNQFLPLKLQNKVYSPSFSPDGNRILTMSSGGITQMWDAQTGQLLQTFQNQDTVESAKFCPDGNFIMTVLENETVTIRDANTNQLSHTLQHQKTVISAQSSPDGTLIATIPLDQPAIIWDAQTGEQLYSCGHKKNVRVTSANFSPDSNLIVTTSWDATVKIWDARTGRLLHTIQSPNPINDAKFTSDGNHITSISISHKATIWGRQPAEQFITWIQNNATLNQISYLSTTLNVPDAAPHGFNNNQIQLLFFNEQGSGFRQTMNDEQFNFLTTVLNIQPPVGVTSDVLQTNVQQRKNVLKKLVTYLQTQITLPSFTHLQSTSKQLDPYKTNAFIEWLTKHATVHQLTYIANKLEVPDVPMREFSENEIRKLWKLKGSGFEWELTPALYRFLTDELGIKNPTDQTPQHKKEQGSVEDNEIRKLWKLKGSGFEWELPPALYRFLDELEIKNPTDQTPQHKKEQGSVEDVD